MASINFDIRFRRNDYGDTYYVLIPIDNQKMWLGFELVSEVGMETNWWNIAIAVFNKRKHAASNEQAKKLTGQNPIAELVYGRAAVRALEQYITDKFRDETNIFYCTWLDNRRRDIYYRVLHKMGYDWGRNPWNEKCIMKKVEANKDDY